MFTIIMAALNILFAVLIIALLLNAKRQKAAKVKAIARGQSEQGNSEAPQPNKSKLSLETALTKNDASNLADDFYKLETLDGYAICLIEFSRVSELYEIFGATTGDKVFMGFCTFAQDFAKRNGGRFYRTAFNQFAFLVKAKNYTAFEPYFDDLTAKLEHITIDDLGAEYVYAQTLQRAVYFLSKENDANVNFQSILDYIDSSMHKKYDDKNCVCAVFEGIDKPDWELNIQLTAQIRKAWEDREIVPYYFPVFDMNTGAVAGAEIVPQWLHSKHGILTQDEFAHALEAAGLMIKLDLYMLEEACRKIQHWFENGILTVPLSINISKRDVHRTDFVECFEKIVTKYKIPPVLIELELPEKILLFEENAKFINIMNTMREKGFSLGMDNFAQNTLSAIGLLRRLPFDVIKIDYRFFSENAGTENGDAFIKNFLNLAEVLKMKIVVENLETKEQVDEVKRFGCANGMGRFFSKLLSDAEFEALID